MSTDPYAPPSGTSDEEPDLDAAVPPLLVRIAGIALAVAGLFVAATGLQTFLFFYTFGWETVMVAALGVVGVTTVALSAWVFNGRDWGTALATAAAWFQVLLTLVWLVYNLAHTVISPIQFLAVAMAALAGLLVPLSLPAAVRVSRARRALYRGL